MAKRRPCIGPRLEVLENRLLLSAPAVASLGDVSVPATSQGGQVSGSYFLGGSFDTGNQSVGGISGSDPFAFGAQLNLNLSGKVGVDLGYSASSGGQVNATYQGVNLQQNYVEPTQFNQQVLFTPQNTNVSYTGGSFSTTGPSASASATLDANINGSIGGSVAFFKEYSGSSNINVNVNQPLFNIGLGSDTQTNDLGLTLGVLGADVSGDVNQLVSDLGASAQIDATPFGPEIPIYIQGGVSGQTQPLGLHENLLVGFGEGEGNEAIGGANELGSMDEFAPNISLTSSSLQNGGVLTDSEQGKIADLNIQAGALLGFATAHTLSIGPASVTFTPVSFQIGPDLTLAQTGTLTPTNQLTYKFSSAVDVTKDGTDLGKVSSVTFTPGVDNIGIDFTGAPITVTPTWNFELNYTDELDLDVNFQGTLTAGQLSAALGPVSSPTLGPAYQQTWNFANYKVATLYDGATLLKSESATLPSFVIGSTFTPSLVVNTTADNNTPFNPTNPDGTGSLRAAVESANLSSSSSPQIIQLGAGTYNLQSIYGGALSVTAQNLVIEGAGAGQTIINASGLGDRVFNVASGANLTLQGVTITGGSVGFTASGGGILNNGTLTLSDSSVTNNSSQDGGGGGIANFGTLTVSDSEIEGNTTFNNGIGNLSLGGGIYNEGVATIVNSTIDNNLALDEGGGIYNVIGDLTVINSTIANNETVSNGGGISNEGFSVTVINSTIAGNSSAGAGGGIYDPQFTPTLLENTIVAGNYQAITPDDISGPVDSNSAYNLIGDSAGLSGISNGSNGNQIGQPNALLDPKLAPLGNYGGATKTMALLQGSPAINAGSNSLAANASLLTDQRGFSRDVGASVDIGAVEYQYDLSLNGHFATKDGALGTVQYVYTVANNGPDPVAGATLIVPLPQGMTFQALTVPTGWTETDPGIGDNGTVAFTDTGSLNSGQSALFSIMGQLQNTTVGAALANTATVSPTASDNNPQNNSVTLTVTNEQEGQAFNNVKLFHFTDPNQNTKAIDFSASVAWSINNINTSGDGSGAVSVVADPNGGFDVLGSHIYAEEGVDGIVVSVSGLDGTVYTSNSQQLFQVADAPLTAGALTPPPNATINQAITNTVLFHFSDADPNGTASDYTATVTWADGSTNNSGDGSGNVSVVANSSGGFNVLGSHTYTQIVNPGTFRVQVSDAGGSSTSASNDTFQVLAPDQPLTAGALNVPSAITEGQSISNQVLFHFSDPDANALPSDYLATVTWGDGSSNNSNDSSSSVAVVVNPNGGFDVIGSHPYGEGSGNYFAVKVTDLGDSRSTQPDLGGQFTGAVSSTPLTISDPPVTVTAGQSFSAVQNTLSRVQTVATFTDPGGPEPNATDPNQAIAPYIATIQWGDGAVTVASLTAQANYTNASVDSQGKITGQIASAANVGGIVLGSDGQTFSVNLAHQYANYGNYTITILLNHEGVLSTPVTTTAVVAGNDNLTATGGAPITSTFGASITNATVATFTDTNTVNPASEFTATITWGDGHSSAGTVSGGNGDFIVMGSHNYATAGNFPIGVTISNFGGTATATANTSATINPAAPTLTVSDVGGTYNSQPFPATGTALGVDGTTPVSGSFSYAYYTSDTLLSAVPVNVGAYTVVATFTSSDPNYTSGTAQTTFTITQATPTISVTDGGAYNGQPFPATATAVGVNSQTQAAGSFSYAYYASGTLLSAAPVNAGAYTVFATFTSSDPNYTGNTGQTTFTIAKATTGFTNLTVQQITLRTATTTLSGQLTSNTILPVGQSVYITLNGVTKPATVGTTGNFSASFATSALGAGTYTISYSYAGDANFNAVTGTGSLTTTYNFSGFLAPLNSNLTLGLNRTIPIKFQLTDTNGNYVTSLSAVTSLQVLNSAGTDVLQGAGKTTLRYDSTANQFIYNWQTKGLSAGTYTIRLTLNDSSTYSLTVQLTASGNGANAQATDGSDVSGDPAGQLVGGDVELYVDNSNGDLTPDELARIQDAINAVDATTAPYGVAIDVVTDPTQADVTLNMSTNSAVGGYSQGILGCYTTSGAITLIQGWDWYAGADPTQVGANQYDFQTTVTHELGHALGLGESTTTTSAMYGTLAPGTVIRTLTTADLNVPYDEGGSDPQRAAVPPISTSASALPGGSAASFQGMTVPSIPGSGSPFSAADLVLADLALLLSNARNAYQSELSSAAALWQSTDALALQRLDALLSLQAGAMGVTKDILMRDLLFAMMSSPNGV